jgi:RNA polymerase subunit RPABC4/transcription elongation factor Spt4
MFKKRKSNTLQLGKTKYRWSWFGWVLWLDKSVSTNSKEMQTSIPLIYASS